MSETIPDNRQVDLEEAIAQQKARNEQNPPPKPKPDYSWDVLT